MQIKIDEGRCTGHARCHATSEAVYPLDDLGFARDRGTGDVVVPTGLEDEAREGALECPEEAIEVREADGGVAPR